MLLYSGIFTLIGLLLNIVSDISYTLVDPRIDFEADDAAFKPRQSGPLGPFSPQPSGYWSLWIFAVLFVLSLCSELIANDKPLLVHFNDRWYVPC